MRTYDTKDVHKWLLEAIWEGLYLEKTLDVNQVIEDLVSYLGVEEARQILHIYQTADL